MKATSAVARPSLRTQTMRAAVIVSPGKCEIHDVDSPKPKADEVRVKLEGCGVCASNIPPWEGREWFKYPLSPGQLGHEAWGHIDAVGDNVTAFHEGDRVAMLSDHAYAEFDVTTIDKVVPLPMSLDGMPFPGEPLGCAMNIYSRSGIQPGQTIVIVGIGFLGSLLTQLATKDGANVIAISRRADSLNFARQMGAKELIPMDDHWRIVERVKELTAGNFCPVVIEAVGKEWPVNLAAELTAERGRLVIAGYHQDGLRSVNLQLWNWRGLDVINAHERATATYIQGIRRAVDAVERGWLTPAPLYTHHYTLEQLGEALEATRTRPQGFMKALIQIATGD
jgi:NADPH:quinone reductase